MRHQRHEPVVAPAGALGQLVSRQRTASLGFNFCKQRSVPPIGQLRARDVAVGGAIARGVIENTVGCIQVYGFKGAHESPAQPEAVFQDFVEVFYRRITIGVKVERFIEHCSLNAVEQKAGDFFFQQHRRLSGKRIQRPGALDHRWRSPWCGRQFHQRHQVRRIHRMPDQYAIPAGQVG